MTTGCGRAASRTWAVLYAPSASTAELEAFELLVFDGEYHPDLAPLKRRGKTVLGYVSVGEIRRDQPDFAAMHRQGVVLHENPDWPGTFLVDLRQPPWTRHIINKLVPAILADGFDGVFIDALENAIHLEESDPQRFGAMTEAAVFLVREIRRRNPKTIIMVNRALPLLSRFESEIDIVLAEAIYTKYNFAKQYYEPLPDSGYRTEVTRLQAATERAPNLRVLTLDYWQPNESACIAHIYRMQRANGFEPYVATVDLKRLVPEPPRNVQGRCWLAGDK